MKKLINFFLGALLGAAIGGILAILFAPGIGSDTRSALIQKFNEVSFQVRQSMEQRRKELEQEIQKLTK